MTDPDLHQDKVADAPSGSLTYRVLPQNLWPHAQLARWDRPIGWQLLLWPCLWSLALASAVSAQGEAPVPFYLFVYHGFLFFIGAVAMRGAGCTYNDLVDQELDAKVARTRSRPLPAGRISRKNAKIFVVIQAAIGALVLFQFNWFTIWLGIASLIVVAIYPFAKRFTDWPQLVLGLAFSWGALVGWSSIYGSLELAPLCLYLSAVFWTIGYDTIYAHQDTDDDALIGVRSTARLFGENTKNWLMLFYSLMVIFLCLSFELAGVLDGQGALIVSIGLMGSVGLLFWQINKLDINDSDQCLALFKSSNNVGLALFVALLLAYLIRMAA